MSGAWNNNNLVPVYKINDKNAVRLNTNFSRRIRLILSGYLLYCYTYKIPADNVTLNYMNSFLAAPVTGFIGKKHRNNVTLCADFTFLSLRTRSAVFVHIYIY